MIGVISETESSSLPDGPGSGAGSSGDSAAWRTISICFLAISLAVGALLVSCLTVLMVPMSRAEAQTAPPRLPPNGCSTTFDSPVAGMATRGNDGYWEVDQRGEVGALGSAPCLGSAGSLPLNQPVVGMAAAPDGGGYWLVAADGGVFTFGDARFFGSAGSLPLNQPVVGMAATPDGGGYWLVAADGGVFTFGDARFFGSAGSLSLNEPVVGMAATPDGGGYWLVAADGGVFTFGDARFFGSAGSLSLNQPVVGMAATPDGGGYWLVAADGGVFTFGDARFFGSSVGRLLAPAVGGGATPDGLGYRLVTETGAVLAHGTAIAEGEVTLAPSLAVTCLASQLGAVMSTATGTAGSTYVHVLLVNRSGFSCSMQGYPSAAFVVTRAGHQIGAASTRLPGSAGAVLVAPQATAQFVVQEFADSFPSCAPILSQGLEIYPPGQPASLFVSQPGAHCGNPVVSTLRVGPVTP